MYYTIYLHPISYRDKDKQIILFIAQSNEQKANERKKYRDVVYLIIHNIN